MSGRMIPPWMKWPRIEAKMYFPRLVTRSTISSISTILLPTRNIIPIGTYLHKQIRAVMKCKEKKVEKHVLSTRDNALLKNMPLLLRVSTLLTTHTDYTSLEGLLYMFAWWKANSQTEKKKNLPDTQRDV